MSYVYILVYTDIERTHVAQNDPRFSWRIHYSRREYVVLWFFEELQVFFAERILNFRELLRISLSQFTFTYTYIDKFPIYHLFHQNNVIHADLSMFSKHAYFVHNIYIYIYIYSDKYQLILLV